MRPIDADALINRIDAQTQHLHPDAYNICDTVGYSVYQIVKEIISRRPTFDPVKHGHWKDCLGKSELIECSVCGGLVPKYIDDYEYRDDCPRFCEWCGAKMDEQPDSEN